MNEPRSILLTGAASGLGRGLATALSAAGHRLFLCDLNLGGANETLAMCDRSRCSAHALDVSSADQIQKLVDSLVPQGIHALTRGAANDRPRYLAAAISNAAFPSMMSLPVNVPGLMAAMERNRSDSPRGTTAEKASEPCARSFGGPIIRLRPLAAPVSGISFFMGMREYMQQKPALILSNRQS